MKLKFIVSFASAASVIVKLPSLVTEHVISSPVALVSTLAHVVVSFKFVNIPAYVIPEELISLIDATVFPLAKAGAKLNNTVTFLSAEAVEALPNSSTEENVNTTDVSVVIEALPSIVILKSTAVAKAVPVTLDATGVIQEAAGVSVIETVLLTSPTSPPDVIANNKLAVPASLVITTVPAN